MQLEAAIPNIKLDSEKHPKELYSIAFSSMWDMFSFYGMKALLIAYIVTQLKLGQPMGYAILGTYAALVFGFNFAGRIIADNFLGTRKSIIWGNYLQIAGHLILAIPLAQPFFAGLALVATGYGFRSSSSSSLVGSFYNNRSVRKKDDGYALYYMMFNMGAALGGLICGYLGQNINWHIGFGAACFFMILGQIQFIWGIKKTQGLPPDITNSHLSSKGNFGPQLLVCHASFSLFYFPKYVEAHRREKIIECLIVDFLFNYISENLCTNRMMNFNKKICENE